MRYELSGSVSADKAYDSDNLLSDLADKRAQAIISPRANRKEQRKFDGDHYRHTIKRFFAKLKQFRRLATRYAQTCFSIQRVCRNCCVDDMG